MLKLTGVACLVVGFAGVLAGCGGDDHGNEGPKQPYSSGLGAKPLSDLTEAEAKQLCEQVGQHFMNDPEFTKAQCLFAGVGIAVTAAIVNASLTDAQLQQQCTEIESACLQADRTPSPTSCQPTGQPAPVPTQPCTATVAELEACVNDARSAMSAFLLQLPSCGAFTRGAIEQAASGGGSAVTIETPQSCAALEQKCPGSTDSVPLPGADDDF